MPIKSIIIDAVIDSELNENKINNLLAENRFLMYWYKTMSIGAVQK